MNKYAIIVAGGKGVRMGAEIPKQFLELNGKPILVHTIEKFLSIPYINIILTLPEAHISLWNALKGKYFSGNNIITVIGGAERFHSVLNGLNAIKDSEGLIAIHDGVRPLVSTEIINNSFEVSKDKGSAVTAVFLKDSIRKVTPSGNTSKNRKDYRAIQTPQTFNLKLLKKAFKQPYSEEFTDDASVFEAEGNSIELIEGDYSNIKITTKEDLVFATSILNKE